MDMYKQATAYFTRPSNPRSNISPTTISTITAVALTAASLATIAASYYIFLSPRRVKKKQLIVVSSSAELEKHVGKKLDAPGPHIDVVRLCNEVNFALPPVLGTLTTITELDLSGNGLDDIPPFFGDFQNLKKLNLSRNKLKRLPPELGNLDLLEDLDLGRNELAAVPAQLGNLKSLKYLNLMANCLEELPEELGQLRALYRLGLKSNKLRALPESIGQMKGLVELFITDNLLEELPASMGQLDNLVKLQASFNNLKTLPREMGQLPRLELLRVAVNSIFELPVTFNQLNSLAWLSIAGNPVCPAPPRPRGGIATVEHDQLAVGEKLGDGASGDVFAVTWGGRQVAFKRFKAETSPDGHCSDEIDITCAVEHPALTRVVGTTNEPRGMLVEKLSGLPMAEKPNFESLLRCRWQKEKAFALDFVLRAAGCIAGALAYLHSLYICHGDVYAHNCLTDKSGQTVLVDYGASFCYTPGLIPYEAHEVRAFGLLLGDLVARLAPPASSDRDPTRLQRRQGAEAELKKLVDKCCNSPAIRRPKFSSLCSTLKVIKEQSL